MDWQSQLISLYLFICNEYSKELQFYCERTSNNVAFRITDEEIITLYLFSLISHQNRLSEMHTYASRHLKDWFPTLPSYVGFVQRLNQIQDVFVPLIEQLQMKLPSNTQQEAYQLIDSMPIILAQRGRRFNAKVAPEIEKYLDAADQLLSTAISRIRQPIEALFSWLEEKTKIQMASKVRSYSGLMVHVFGRIAAAFLLLVDKTCS